MIKRVWTTSLTMLLVFLSSAAAATAPAAEGGIVVEGVTKNYPPTDLLGAQAASAIPSIMEESFEGAWPTPGWALDDFSTTDGGEYLWGQRDCHPRTGDFGAWAVGGGTDGSALSCGDTYPNNANTWAVYGPFSLRTATSASLTFRLWGRVQGGEGCPYDQLFVGSSRNGSSFVGSTYCSDYSNGSAGNGYYRQTLDLNSELGQDQVWVAFAFFSDEADADGGFTIDDLELTIAKAPPSFNLSWNASELDFTTSIAWGDYDNDGDLDLALGNGSYYLEANRLYENEAGVLAPSPVWSSAEADDTRSVAWGDYDGDGDLDLAVGNGCHVSSGCQPNRLYRNDEGQLTTAAVWTSNDAFGTLDVAWVDYDGDGDLDLAAGNTGPNALYRNEGGTLTNNPAWTSGDQSTTNSIAWGDYDGDGDLDLAAGNSTANRLYRNDNGTLTSSAVWTSPEEAQTKSIAWGDYDGDGDPDLAVGNTAGSATEQLYRNDEGSLTLDTAWFPTTAYDTSCVSWGDYDGDGDLDLAASSWGDLMRLYRNDDGQVTEDPVWFSPEINYGNSLAWGDYDNDGDLDLAIGNWNAPSRLYDNDEGSLTPNAGWTSFEAEATTALAWGDYDADGDLDLAVSNSGHRDGWDWVAEPDRMYRNDAGNLTTGAVWTSAETDRSRSVAFGDVDQDGDLDLATGGYVYSNNDGILTSSGVWSGGGGRHPAWADVDRDDDLDLLQGGDYFDTANLLYQNDSGTLDSTPIWSSAEASDPVAGAAWGDVDGDGDPDLAVANGCYGDAGCYPARLYRNDGGVMQAEAIWASTELESSTCVAWGDVDGDGDMDLAVGNDGAPNRLYCNDAGTLTPTAVWSSEEADMTQGLAWGDYDGDGDLDLAAANAHVPNRVYRNDGGTLTPAAAWHCEEASATSSVAWGDVDGDGDLDLAVGNGRMEAYYEPNQLYLNTRDNYASAGSIPIVSLAHPGSTDSADFFSTPEVLEDGRVSISYTLFHRDSQLVREVRGYYSLNGGGEWQPAVTTSDTITTDLESAPYPATLGNTHVYHWDVLGSGVMGQYDDVVFRLVAIPAITQQAYEIAGPYHYGSYGTTTFPFRVRGSQVRVISGTQPVANAIVYRLPAGQTSGGTLFADAGGSPFRTNRSGYLQGHGQINLGDHLLALAPVTQTERYSLYLTNGTPTPTGVTAHAVTSPGEQTLNVSAEHPLHLFNLDISLEWDAHLDTAFLKRLEYDLHRAAEHFYDFTDGQATLGEVYVFHNAENWQTAHMRIYATNRLRPNATLGGSVTTTITDTRVPTITYQAGQIRMPPTWNRYGDPRTGGIGEDWPRTLAHEMGHYYLYLDDHYLGLDESGQVVSIDDCTGTAMMDPYRYSEYRDQADWLPACQDTMANHLTGRSDWETISAFYPNLNGPDDHGVNEGPGVMPFNFTEITLFEPLTPTETIADPTFYFLNEAGQHYQPTDGTRGFLIKDQTWLVDVGEPVIDHILARGAKPGDRLCVFDFANSRLGCETIAPADDQMILYAFPDWEPEILVSPLSTNTITVTVHAPPSLPLKGRAYSSDGPATSVFNLTEQAFGTYTARATSSITNALLLEGSVHIWVDEAAPRREMITDYSIGASPAALRGHGAALRGHGAALRGHGAALRGHGAALRGHGAPVLSGDGQLTFYTPDPTIPEGEFLTVQASTGAPLLPAGRLQIGSAYRIAATAGLSGLTESSISFQYRGEAVPAGMEEDITIYHYDEGEEAWKALPTTLNARDNFASASSAGSGLYALLTAFQVPLEAAGWNLFSYPLRESQPINWALASIDGYYATVYGYDVSDEADPWKIYDVETPDYVNDLDQLAFGQGYWISVTQPITAHFGSHGSRTAATTYLPPQVPATFYGPVTGATSRQTVTAWVGNTLCGQGTTVDVDGQVVYDVNVLAEAGGTPGCGAPGREVRFQLGSQVLTPTALWNDSRPYRVALQAGEPSNQVYLPLVLKQD